MKTKDFLQLEAQLKRLSEVNRKQWRAALSVLMMEISLLLHGRLKDGENGKDVVVGFLIKRIKADGLMG